MCRNLGLRLAMMKKYTTIVCIRFFLNDPSTLKDYYITYLSFSSSRFKGLVGTFMKDAPNSMIPKAVRKTPA